MIATTVEVKIGSRKSAVIVCKPSARYRQEHLDRHDQFWSAGSVLGGWRALWLFEEVFVDLLEDEGFLGDDAAVVFDHESG